ncbi:hypothetical protein EHP00_1572 [Ecytonucleospora hepatopenaei]|uniref:Uncharacterized protein n=1 Tax=Ecytonucleospora hepatopenaei TaxID=646526 RepID=A0A1W0E704_9MICR|nr:hypothetical protein EHP00_1572 [Ecytonucleospora hepatopenaei]
MQMKNKKTRTNNKTIVSRIKDALNSFEDQENTVINDNRNNYNLLDSSIISRKDVPNKRSLPVFSTKVTNIKRDSSLNNFKKVSSKNNVVQLYNEKSKERKLSNTRIVPIQTDVKECTISFTTSYHNNTSELLEEICENKKENTNDLKVSYEKIKDSTIKESSVQIDNSKNISKIYNENELGTKISKNDYFLVKLKEIKERFLEFPTFIDKIYEEYNLIYNKYNVTLNNFNLQVEFIQELKKNIEKYQFQLNELQNEHTSLTYSQKLLTNEVENFKLQKKELSGYVDAFKKEKILMETETLKMKNENTNLIKENIKYKTINSDLILKQDILKKKSNFFVEEKKIILRNLDALEADISDLKKHIIEPEVLKIHSKNLKYSKLLLFYKQEILHIKREINKPNIKEISLLVKNEILYKYKNIIKNKQIIMKKINDFENNEQINMIKNLLLNILEHYKEINQSKSNKMNNLQKTIENQKKQITDLKRKHTMQIKLYEKTILDLNNKINENKEKENHTFI